MRARHHKLLVNAERALFIHIPKTAGTSIIGSLMANCNYVNRDHLLAAQYRTAEWDSSYSFAVVRNPFERLVSHWKYHTTNYTGRIFTKHGIDIQNKSLNEYIDVAYALDHTRLNWRSMVEYITHPCGKPIDQILRFETLTQDWQTLCTHFNIKLSLLHLNQTPHDDYKQYYTPETKNKVQDWYAVDLERFGYAFD
jgi:chondroitin 4-sulfotransferase 11